VTLWRPVGPGELEFIVASGYRAFLPRPPEQPLFYPVLTEEYALQIARDGNVPQSGAGFVTRFRVRSSFLSLYKGAPGGRSAPLGVLDPRRGAGGVQPGDRGLDRGHPEVSLTAGLGVVGAGHGGEPPGRHLASSAGTAAPHPWKRSPVTSLEAVS